MPTLKPILQLIPYQVFAAKVLSRLTIRIHTGIVSYRVANSDGSTTGARWAKLWYLLRGLDTSGAGYCQILLEDVADCLGVGQSTIYQWLREGEWAGAFRRWWIRRGVLSIFLSSLTRLSAQLGLVGVKAWGTVAEIPLHEVRHLKPWATAAQTQRLQQESRFAAVIQLAKEEQRLFRVPKPEQFFSENTQQNTRPSDDPQAAAPGKRQCRGVLPCVLHIGPSRVFASKGLIPYGTDQTSIAMSLNYRSDRTVRRHHELLGVQSRQLVQAKAAYKPIRSLLEDSTAVNDKGYLSIGSGSQEIALCSLQTRPHPDAPAERRSKLFEPNGGSSARRDEGFLVTKQKFFHYWGKDWIYRCNLYKPIVTLCSMAERRLSYKRYLSKQVAVAADNYTHITAVSHREGLCTTPLESLQHVNSDRENLSLLARFH